jgi:hypothetical protein
MRRQTGLNHSNDEGRLKKSIFTDGGHKKWKRSPKVGERLASQDFGFRVCGMRRVRESRASSQADITACAPCAAGRPCGMRCRRLIPPILLIAAGGHCLHSFLCRLMRGDQTSRTHSRLETGLRRCLMNDPVNTRITS